MRGSRTCVFFWHMLQTQGTQRQVDPWLLQLYGPYKLCVASHDANTVLSLMKVPLHHKLSFGAQ